MLLNLRTDRPKEVDVYGPLSNALEAIKGGKKTAYGAVTEGDSNRILQAAYHVCFVVLSERKIAR